MILKLFEPIKIKWIYLNFFLLKTGTVSNPVNLNSGCPVTFSLFYSDIIPGKQLDVGILTHTMDTVKYKIKYA